MKILIIIKIILFTWAINAVGQVSCLEDKTATIQNGDTIFSYYENPPYLKEGFEPYMKWIKKNIDKRLTTKGKAEKKKVYIGYCS